MKKMKIKSWKRTTKQFSQASEKQAQKETGARIQIASGALKFAKGDLIDDRFLYEDKITDSARFSLTKALVDKLEREALQHGRMPVFRITIQGKTMYVLSKYSFVELLNQDKD